MHRHKEVLRAVGVGAASLGLVSVTATAGQASNDWTRISEPSWQDVCLHVHRRAAEPKIAGAKAASGICWGNYQGQYRVVLSAAVTDTRSDGYGVREEVRYKRKVSGGWSKWKHRFPVTNRKGKGHRVGAYFYEARYRTKGVEVRVEEFNKHGKVAHKSAWR